MVTGSLASPPPTTPRTHDMSADQRSTDVRTATWGGAAGWGLLPAQIARVPPGSEFLDDSLGCKPNQSVETARGGRLDEARRDAANASVEGPCRPAANGHGEVERVCPGHRAEPDSRPGRPQAKASDEYVYALHLAPAATAVGQLVQHGVPEACSAVLLLKHPHALRVHLRIEAHCHLGQA